MTRSRLLSVGSTIVMLAGLLLVRAAPDATSPVAQAQQAPLSPGCVELNNPVHDDMYWSDQVGPAYFNDGEEISIIAQLPASGIPEPPIRLIVNGVVVATGPFPGMVTYTIAADGFYLVEWQIERSGIFGDGPSWTVACAAATPTPTPTPWGTGTPTPTNTPEPTSTPTNTPEPTSTPTPSNTPTATGTPSSTRTAMAGRVEICHKPGTPAEKTMTLPRGAVEAHLGHGDTLGAC